MILIVTNTYPNKVTNQVAEKFFKMVAKGNPQHIKKWLTYGTDDDKDGFKGYHIIYIEKGKVDEGIIEVYKIFGKFSDIEGFKTKTEVLISVKDMSKIM